jgi:hypothetical protein
MYLRQSKQTRSDGRVVTYLQLAENAWDATKGRSQARIVFNFGRADDPQVIERLRRLAKSILRRCSAEEIVAESPDWRLLFAWPYGDIYVFGGDVAAAGGRRDHPPPGQAPPVWLGAGGQPRVCAGLQALLVYVGEPPQLGADLYF